jgi:hypothetical protein
MRAASWFLDDSASEGSKQQRNSIRVHLRYRAQKGNNLPPAHPEFSGLAVAARRSTSCSNLNALSEGGGRHSGDDRK